ncbi:hypothetical protein [Enterococcus sp. HY326]|uniref:hypothetical protein n=1 Tax=Enterococcus sp. HY326 TaxID=2971265 RepID=UPI0022400236|nr:hypothetical protein [Enterococcus sp. HY326]
MLNKIIKSECYKVLSFPLFWFGIIFVFGISIFFSIQNIQAINAMFSGNFASVNLESNILSETPAILVRDAILSSPYQTSVLFLPILIALVYATEYQFGQELQSQLLITNWQKRTTGRIISLFVIVSIVTLVFAIVNCLLLFILLTPTLKTFLTFFLVGEVTLRVLLFSVVLGLLSLVFVTLTKKSIPSLVLIVLLLILSLTGLLGILAPDLNNILPLLGAKSFAFGRVEAGQTSQLYGFLLLLIESVLSCSMIYGIEWKKEQRC